MSSGSNPSIKADLFSPQQSPDTSSPSASEPKPPLRTDEPAAASSPSYALPTNLPSALRHLDDDQLDRLLAAVIAELKQRGRKPPASDETSRKRRIEAVAVSLTISKMNAVRAAFKAGVKLSQIARQFGVSQSDVRKALANNPPK
jgi:predicted DNA-binding protein (UPF0251 family)